MPVRLEVSNNVATLLLDRPKKRNALDVAMLESLREQVRQVRDSRARVVVLRGAGGVFSAGADLADWVAPTPAQAAERSRLGREVFTELSALPQPSVAVVTGVAAGGGLELALACDLRVADPHARLGFPEARLGNLPAWGGLARLIGAVGVGVARHLLLTGDLFSGERAGQLLVVDRVAADVEGALSALVHSLLAGDPWALSTGKQVLAGFDVDLGLEPLVAAHVAGLESSRQRKQAFLEERAARRVDGREVTGEGPHRA